MNRRLTNYIVIAVASASTASLPHSVLGQDHTSVHLSFDAAIPAGFETVFTAECARSDGSVLSFMSPEFGVKPVIAQRESDSSRIRFVAALQSEVERGATTDISARPIDRSSVVTIHEKSGGFQFLDDDRPVLFYQKDAKSKNGGHTRSNYVHPLLSLDGGELTEEFPDDHRHHHGVFWAWHQFLIGGKPVGDPWVTKDFLVEVRSARIVEQGPVFATLSIIADWTSPRIVNQQGEKRALVRETTTIRLYRSLENAQYVDFVIRLSPLVDDVKLGGADNARGYSGFTVRLPPPAEMIIRNASQVFDEDSIGSESPWADVSGRFDRGDRTSGIAILGHATLPEFPSRWLLRHYGMQNVVYPGRHPVLLSAESPLLLRHRLVIHRGDAVEARIADHQMAYERFP